MNDLQKEHPRWYCPECQTGHENVWCLHDLSWYADGFNEFEQIGSDRIFMNGQDYDPFTFQNYNSIIPSYLEIDSMICCGELPKNCTCKDSWKTTWDDCISYLQQQGLNIDDIYHSDTESTCDNCMWKGSYKCIPLRDMLSVALDWGQNIELITACDFYHPIEFTSQIHLPRDDGEDYNLDQEFDTFQWNKVT